MSTGQKIWIKVTILGILFILIGLYNISVVFWLNKRLDSLLDLNFALTCIEAVFSLAVGGLLLLRRNIKVIIGIIILMGMLDVCQGLNLFNYLSKCEIITVLDIFQAALWVMIYLYILEYLYYSNYIRSEFRPMSYTPQVPSWIEPAKRILCFIFAVDLFCAILFSMMWAGEHF